MRFHPIETIQTSRLVLRKVRSEDIQDYFDRLGSSEAVTRGMLWEPHTDLSQSVASVEKALRRYEEGGCYRWAVALPEDDRIIGIVEMLRFDESDDSCSFAYMLGESWWGKGYGSEALRGAMDFVFSKMGVKVVRADHFTTNPASGGAMRKAGMTYVKTIPEQYEKHGVKLDADLYQITKEAFYKEEAC